MIAEHQLPEPDLYRWLEDPNSPRTRQWLLTQRHRAETEFARIGSVSAFREALDEAVNQPAPARSAGAWQLRLIRDLDHPGGAIGATGPDRVERVVFDARAASAEAVITRWDPSPGGTHLAVQVVLAGDETSTPLHLIRIATGETARPVLPDVRHSPVEWINDDSFLYVRASECLHRFSIPDERDELVFRVPGRARRIRHRLWHGRWVTVSARHGAASANALWLIDLGSSGPPWSAELITEAPDHEAIPLLRCDGRVLLLTTAGADRGRIVAVDASPASPRIVVPESRSTLRAAAVIGGPARERLLVIRDTDNIAALSFHDVDSGAKISDVELPGVGTVLSIEAGDQAPEGVLRYTDWVTPPTRYAVDGAARCVHPIDLDARPTDDIRTDHRHYPSTGGVQVPVTVLSPAGERRPRPTVLSVYGGFGVPVRPSFQPDALAWVRAGGAIAFAQIRGSGGRGRQWHRDGCAENKQNAIDDLHAAADWLLASGVAERAQLVLLGVSHGGLMATAAIVQSPERYAAAAAVAPLTDLARYERFGLGTSWTAEYGTAADPDQLRRLLGYSPFHNVRPGRRYPPLLLIAGTNDTRVDPLHSRKLCARLQDADPQGGPAILRMVDAAGHTAGSTAQQLDTASTILSFLAFHSRLAGR